MIRIEKLTKTYQKGSQEIRAVREMDLEIPPGSFLSLVGRSGSGKSTLLQLVGGLDRPTSGQLWVAAPEPKDLAVLTRDELTLYRRHHVGFIFQAFHLLPTLTVLENVLIPAVPDPALLARRTREARDLLARLELHERLDHLPAELSGGQQQRVAIARALINQPSLILADEPTGELDSETARVIVNLLVSLNREGKTVIIATHDQGLARQARELIYLEDGKIIRKEKT